MSSPETELNWDALYEGLSKLNGMLECPQDNTTVGISNAIKSARQVESLATFYYTKFSRKLAEAKSAVASLKTLYKANLSSLLLDSDFCEGESRPTRKAYAEAKLIEDFERLERAEDHVMKVQLYIKALERVLAAAKHTREDIGRKLKLIDIDKEIKAL